MKWNIKCKTCGKDHIVKRCLNIPIPKYCSTKCYADSIRHERIEFSCAYCGKKLIRSINKKNKFCPNNSCAYKARIGVPRSDITKKKISISNKEAYKLPERRKVLSLRRLGKPNYLFRGENNPRWNGGTTSENYKIRGSLEMKEWKRKVLRRDNFTCQWCGKIGGKLQVDHIVPFVFVKKEAELFNEPKIIFDIDNGRTLCISCHQKTDTYMFKASKHVNNVLFDLLKKLWEKQGKLGEFKYFYKEKMDEFIQDAINEIIK